MNTRFDNKRRWIKADGTIVDIEKMTTPHLINTLAMFNAKPGTVMLLIIEDIESGNHADPVWVAERLSEDVATSLHNVSTMKPEALVEYAMNSKLGMAMRHQLEMRGVCVKSAIEAVNYTLCKKEV